MKIRIEHGLPFVAGTLKVGQTEVVLEALLLDTGSAGTVLSADRLLEVGIKPAPQDALTRIRGVGGSEWVFAKRIDRLAIGNLVATDLMAQVGALDYGLPLDGIVGMDFLMQVGAVLDLAQMTLA